MSVLHLSMVNCIICFLLNWGGGIIGSLCNDVTTKSGNCCQHSYLLYLGNICPANEDFKGLVDLELHLVAIVSSPGNLD